MIEEKETLYKTIFDLGEPLREHILKSPKFKDFDVTSQLFDISFSSKGQTKLRVNWNCFLLASGKTQFPQTAEDAQLSCKQAIEFLQPIIKFHFDVIIFFTTTSNKAKEVSSEDIIMIHPVYELIYFRIEDNFINKYNYILDSIKSPFYKT